VAGESGTVLLVDREAWKLKGDGHAVRLPAEESLPFALLCRFEAGKPTAVPLGGMTRQDIENQLAAMAAGAAEAYAVRIDGRFRMLELSNGSPEDCPYVEAAPGRAPEASTLENVDGTLIGFRIPAFLDSLQPAGTHFHFIRRDRARGGHVLAFEMLTGSIWLHPMNMLQMQWPAHAGSLSVPPGMGESP
jgi:acetolactate decarboxylase